jgi:predicted nucleic acid-binding protein
MSNQTHQVDQYPYSQDDRLLLDANVWLLLYGPQYSDSRDQRVNTYSAAMKRILAGKCQIFIDVLILSEFVNASARFAYNILPKQTPPIKFKDFRKSRAFVRVAQEIAVACRKIMAICAPLESGFETLDTAKQLSSYETGQFDFNDQVLASLCETRQLKLVTDDADFSDQRLTILTANRRLLGR